MELALPATIAEEAGTYLSQGRDLFDAAERVGMTSRPLLLYYSFMNLAKALIKSRQPALDLRGATHGIDEPQTNRLAQRFRLTSQQVRIQHPNQNRAHLLNAFAAMLGWAPLPPARQFHIPTLLSQIPAIHRSYATIARTAETLHPITGGEFRFNQQQRQLWGLIYVKRGPGLNLSKLRSRHYFRAFFSQRESDPQHSDVATLESQTIAYPQNP